MNVVVPLLSWIAASSPPIPGSVPAPGRAQCSPRRGIARPVVVEDFDARDPAGLFALALATRSVELEGVAHAVLGLSRDHVVGEIFGRQGFAARDYFGEAGDATHAS